MFPPIWYSMSMSDTPPRRKPIPVRGRLPPNALAGRENLPLSPGRASLSNPAGRFETHEHDPNDPWGEPVTQDNIEPERIKTELTAEAARSVITFNRSPDIHFDRSINPYRGCEHGCIYCFARPSHAFNGLSSGLDFETRLFYKPDAPERLREELNRPGYVPRPIALGVNTDAYQPVERETGLTRKLLEVLDAFQHPVSLLTKAALIRRDIDIIAPMAQRGLARVGISLTTLDRRLARQMEPRAATPELRLETIHVLTEAGIPVTVMTAPVIPGLNDHELEALLTRAREAGASSAGYVLLRLPHDVKELFHDWLARHQPGRAQRVINRLREMRGGRDYDARWFERGTGTGPEAELLAQRFRQFARRLGLDLARAPLRTDLFRPQEGPDGQLRLDV
jgi:DNA repair photolyase